MTENFIMQAYIDDLNVCDRIITFFNHNKQYQFPGAVVGYKVKKDIKDSIDMIDENLPEDLWNSFYNELNNVMKKYVEKYEYSLMCPFGFIQPGNIQYYKPGMAFHKFHCERDDVIFPGTTRHLAWMTYLNDVDDGGETEFYYQKLKVKPRKGLTLIWPADWTHTHRGLPSLTEEKYIITGWANYIERNIQPDNLDKVIMID